MRRLTGVGAPASLHRCDYHLYNGLQTVSAWDIIRHSILVCKGAFAVFIPAALYVWWNMILTLCRLALCSVFIFPRHPEDGSVPWRCWSPSTQTLHIL
jgi:hypothetical protein